MDIDIVVEEVFFVKVREIDDAKTLIISLAM